VNPPTRFGRFEVIGELGKGAMGVVYKARDPVIDREVAIKTLSAEGREDPDLRERFTREARSAGILHHPSIITVYDVGEEDGIPFLALEYLEGRTLQELVNSGERLSLVEKVRILEQVANGLNYAHERGVIHRDVKPENVMILSDGTAKITDFGIARSESTDKTRPGVVLGSVGYMAPEQIKGMKLDRRADVFSLGIVAYELLTGRRAFPGDNIPAVMGQILNSTPPPPSTVVENLPEKVDEVTAKVLAKERDERYASADEFIEQLKAAVGTTGLEPPIPVPEEEEEGISIEDLFGAAEFEEPEETARARPFSLVHLVLFVLIVLGLGAGAFFGYMRYSDVQERELQQEIARDLEVALVRINEGDYEEAISGLRAVLEKDPYNSEAAVLLAKAQARLLQMDRIPPLREQAAAAIAAGNLPAAIELYRRILDIDPQDPEAEVRIAELEQRIRNQGRVQELLIEARQAFERGRYREATALWEEVFSLDPGNVEAREGIEQAEARLTGLPELDQLAEEAEELYRNGEYTQAIALWDRILQVQPENEALRTRINTARALSALADQLNLWRRRAQESHEQGDYEEAMRAWQRVLDYRPFDAEAREGLRQAREAMGG